MNKYKKQFLLPGLLVWLLSSAVSCHKEPKPEFVNVILEIPLRITPVQDTVALGDTLWLEADFADTVRDHKSGRYYHLPPTFDLKTRIAFVKLVSNEKTISDQPGFASGFEVINTTGGVEDLRATFGSFRMEHEGNRYRARIGLVPRREGVAAVNFLNGWLVRSIHLPDPDLSFLDLGTTAEGGKRIPVLENVYYIINGGNTNFHLFRQHCKAGSLEFMIEPTIYFEQKATFTFVAVQK